MANYLKDTTARGLSALIAMERPRDIRKADVGASPDDETDRAMLRDINATTMLIRFLAISVPLSIGLSAYHGYKRNDSLGWGIGWGLLGGLLPIITPAIAFAEGFGVRKP